MCIRDSIRTAQDELERYAPATAQKNINLSTLDNLVVPVPPLSEMRRIIATVEDVLSLCDRVESELELTASAQDALASAIFKSEPAMR